MPLSEHEQRLLEQIERALYADDPKLASTVKAINPRAHFVRRIRRCVGLFFLGLVVLVVGVAINKGALTVALGFAGFVLMLFAALRGATDLKRLGGRTDPSRPGTAAKRKPRATFMQRVEQRWRRREEGRGR
jgi:hypothetical protein